MRFRSRRVLKTRVQSVVLLISVIFAAVTTTISFAISFLAAVATGVALVIAVLAIEHFFPGFLLVPRRAAPEK